MEAVADRNVDQPVLAADGHGRLGPVLRERKQARSLSAAEDERKHFMVHRSTPLRYMVQRVR